MLNRTYELDMVPGGIPLSIHLSQYDSDVTLTFQLFASQGTLDIPNSGVTAQIRGTKLDGNGISAACTFAIVNSIPTVTVQMTKQMTAIAGKNTFEIVLKVTAGSTEYELPSANFYLDVERAALDYNTLVSASQIQEIEEILSDADGIIAALEVSQTTQANMAALTIRAETAATSAEADATAATQAKNDAVSAKDTAVGAVNGFNATVNAATASAVASVQSEAATQIAAVEAAGADMEEYAEGVVDDAKDEITAAKNTATAAISTAQNTAVSAVNTAKNTAMSAISDAADEITDIKSEADTTAALAVQQANSAMNEVSGIGTSIQVLQTNYSTLNTLLGSKVDGGYVENGSLYTEQPRMGICRDICGLRDLRNRHEKPKGIQPNDGSL